MKKGKMHAVNFVSTRSTSEKRIKVHWKDNKGKDKSTYGKKKFEIGEQDLKPKKPYFKGNCQFYKKIWA